MQGFLVIDKPQGLTSHGVVARLRRLLATRRIGHTGTLDPLATGVLPIAVEGATRLIPFLREEHKVYRATLRFGSVTDTQDAAGQVLASAPVPPLDEAALRRLFAGFVGDLLQVPPMYSALKRQGVPLYRLARRGEIVEREPRPVRIESLGIDAIVWPEVTFTVRCSRGTYVRTLAHDLGAALGCGAHLTMLRRLESGPFTLAEAQTLEEIETCLHQGRTLRWIGPRAALAGHFALTLTDTAAERLRHGISPRLSDITTDLPPAPAEVLLCASAGELLAVARFVGAAGDPKPFVLQRVLVAGEG